MKSIIAALGLWLAAAVSASALSLFPIQVPVSLPPPPPPGASTFDTTRNTGGLMTFSNNNLTAAATTLGSAGGTAAFTTQFHSSGLWNFRFTINNCPTPPGCQIGLASALESNNISYLGHNGAHSVDIDSAGIVVINNTTISSSTPAFTTGDVMDVEVNLNNKTIQVSKNNGPLSQPVSIASLGEFTLSPAVSADLAGGAGGSANPLTIVQTLTDHGVTSSHANGTQKCAWQFSQPIGTGNTVVGYVHSADVNDQNEMYPNSVYDNAGHTFGLTPGVHWQPWNEDIGFWYLSNIQGNPNTFTFDYTQYPASGGTVLDFCDVGFVEYSGATGLTVVNPRLDTTSTPSVTITPAAPALIWAFASPITGSAGFPDTADGINNSGYTVIVNDIPTDEMGVWGSPSVVPASPLTLTWNAPAATQNPCDPSQVSPPYNGCPTVVGAVAVLGGSGPPALPVPTAIAPTTTSALDTATAGSQITAINVSTSDSSTFTGTLTKTADPDNLFAVSGYNLTVGGSNLTSGNNGTHSVTVQACENSTCISQAISVSISAPSTGPITRIDGTWDGQTGGFSDAQLGVNPIPNGSAVFGATLHESCFSTGGGSWCTIGHGDLDHVNVGSQQATILGTVNDPRCESSSACGAFVSGMGSGGFAVTYWWLPNVQGNPTTIDLIASSGGQMAYAGSIVSIFSGIPSNATLDSVNGIGYSDQGSWNGPCCSDGKMTSTPITPTVSGDFLWGAAVDYGCSGMTADTGAGWTLGSIGTAFYGKSDEYMSHYNSTAPFGATFPSPCGGVNWVGTVAIKLQ